MPTPLEICLEDLEDRSSGADPLRCVALPGGEPGLALDRQGAVRWMPADAVDHGLWKQVKQTAIVAETTLKKPVKATTVRSYVRW